MRRFRIVCAALASVTVLASTACGAAPKKALFDNTHQETAGNADWQIDTDQPLPVPDQSTVTPGTTESYWLGAISAWGIGLVKKGYSVATLTTLYGITYGSVTNPYDLSKYDLFVVDEPNTAFTRAESTAIFNYLRDGGGMFAVCDHAGSDRNSDGVDSPKAWGRLDQLHLLGAHFDSTGEGSSGNNNFSQNSGNVDTALSDSIIHGPVGVGDSISFHNGTSMELYPAVNASVRGAIWQNGLTHGNSGVMTAYASYGKGRVVFVGDSSPCDDGSAAPGNSSIFNGWGEATGRDSLVFMNGSLWATRTYDTTPPVVSVLSPNGGESVLQGSDLVVTWTASDSAGVDSVSIDFSLNGAAGPWTSLLHGGANSGSVTWTTPFVVSDSVIVRVTAFDPSRNQGSDVSDGFAHITAPVGVALGGGGGVPFHVALAGASPVRGPVQLTIRAPSAGAAQLVVEDVAGRRVWSEARTLPAGETRWSWAGRDTRGAHVPAGVYTLRCTTPWGAHSVRVVRVGG